MVQFKKTLPKINNLCRRCNQVKSKIWSGEVHKRNQRVFVDETGREWKGRACPDCAKEVRREINAAYACRRPDRVLRAKPKPEAKDIRYCKPDHGGCGKKLPQTRYFLCHRCKPNLGDDGSDVAHHRNAMVSVMRGGG